MKNTILAVICSAAFMCSGTFANYLQANNPQGGGVQDTYKKLKFPPVEDFQPKQPVVKELKNGLRVYLMEDHELPHVRARAMIRAGSAYEPADKVGLASVVAQTMRSGGTAKNPGDKLDDELGALAASIDVSIGPISGAPRRAASRRSCPASLISSPTCCAIPPFRRTRSTSPRPRSARRSRAATM